MINFQLDEFFDTKNLDKTVEFYEKMNAPKFLVKDTGMSYRVINHWDKKGLIRCHRREDGAGDRKFSFADFVWIKVVEELRAFGVPVPTIKKITDDIYTPIPIKEIFAGVAENISLFDGYEGKDKDEVMEFLKSKEFEGADFSGINIAFLHLLIVSAIAERDPIALIVFKNGEWFPFNPTREQLYSDEILNRKKFSSHISICLLDVAFQFFGSNAAEKFLKQFKLLSPQEENLLEEISKGQYKKVTVLFKTRKYEPVEIKKGKTTKEQLLQIIRDKQYREFIITDNKGKEFKIKGE